MKKEMKIKKRNLILIVLALFFSLALMINFGFVSAQTATGSTGIGSAASVSSVSYCCERTTDGAFCQNAPLSQCDSSYKSTPTACESTSFCQKGTCYDSDEGLCMENVPEEACKQANGQWSGGAPDEIPQCSLGCCVIGQEAAFTTLQRCKKLTADFGLITDWRNDIGDEVSCIALATAEEVGACVYESEFVTTCKFGTRSECDSSKINGLTNSSSVTFYDNYLCTNPEFNTNCEKTTQTICLDDKQAVYFVDSCGNPANIYDASRINDEQYWTDVIPREDACNAGGENANSISCGNCNYLEGSFCGEASGSVKPAYGNNICQDINCYDTSNGKDYKNGESWCYWDAGKEDSDAVGSRAFRHVCFMGEETVEPCADYRQETCVQDDIDEFSQAGCVVNRWQDCILQNKSSDCLNTDQRDCQWLPVLTNGKVDSKGLLQQGLSSINSVAGGLLGGLIGSKTKDNENADGNWRCVPTIAPGLQFWDATASDQCNLASQSCLVKYEKKLVGKSRKCVENCDCLDSLKETEFNLMCTNYGDCGNDKNYVGKYTAEGIEVSVNKVGKEEAQSQRKPAEPGGSQTFGGSGGSEFSTPDGQGGRTSASSGGNSGGAGTQGTQPAPSG